MIKIRITYSDEVEKDKLVDKIHRNFIVLHKSKEYPGKGKSPHKSIYMDLSNK